MLFRNEHIEQIRAGEKTATRRTWDRRHVRPGGTYIASTEMFTSHTEADCYIRVTDIRIERLGDMTETDAQAEGGYSLEEFREVWRDINGGWDPAIDVYVVEFEYAGRTRSGQEVPDARE